MSAEERYKFEREAQKDPFLYEAMEGFENISSKELNSSLGELNSRLSNHKKQRKTIIWAAAASFLMIAAVSFVLYTWNSSELTDTNKTLSLQEANEEPEGSEETKLFKNANPTEPSDEISSSEPLKEDSPQPQKLETKVEESEEALISEPETDMAVAEESSDLEIDPETESLTLAYESELKTKETTPAKIETTTIQDSSVAKMLEGKAEGLATTRESSRSKRAKSATSRAEPSAAPASQNFLDKEEINAVAINGQIIDADDESPLMGSSILIKGGTVGTSSDLDGKFTIVVPNDSAVLVFSYIGYITQELKVGNNRELIIKLNIDNNTLSEVVMIQSKSEVGSQLPPRPKQGFFQFKRYIRDNLIYPKEAIDNNIEGKVIIEFTVQSNGTLSDFKVIESLGYGCDQEAIRLIREGPAWLPAEKDGQKISDQVRRSIRFKQ